jgi:phospholipase C
MAGAAAGFAVGARVRGVPNAGPLPDIQHIVLVMMENRSFDHILGWVPGADGEQAGLSFLDRSGQMQATAPLAPDYQGCGHSDPDHSYDGGRVEYNDGACDGWLLAGDNDRYSIGYYTAADLPFFAGAAQHWLTCDGYFPAIMAPTFPNRIYQHAGQTDRLENSLKISSLPTIWDRLAAANLTGLYYFSDVPFVALWGRKYKSIARRIDQFFAACQTGALPNVAFVDPKMLGENLGISVDDHPFADIRNGQSFLNSVYNAVVQSPAWSQTVLVINYDEWGGFFDHVPPPPGPIPPATSQAGDADGLRGFRVANFIISPWTPRGTVGHGVFDHTSVLRMIEWRWNLTPLTVRDSTAANLANLLDFNAANVDAPTFDVPAGPLGRLCLPSAASRSQWEGLRALAERHGFVVPRGS